MTGYAALAAFLALALVGSLHLRRRRKGTGQRPMVLATPGGRAFASHVGMLSDFRMGLELPRARR